MKTVYLKMPHTIPSEDPKFFIKVTEKSALDITDDAINIIFFDDESEYFSYIGDMMSRDILTYVHATKEEFDNAFIKVVGLINEISKI